MVVVTVKAVCGQKWGEPSKFWVFIHPLQETEAVIHSKNLPHTIDNFNGWTGETKTAFSVYALNCGRKKIFFSKNIGKVGTFVIFSRNFFFLIFPNFFWNLFFATKFMDSRFSWGTRVLVIYEGI